MKIVKLLKNIIKFMLIILGLITITILLYMQQSKFGKNPGGEKLAQIKKSPNYKNGQFQNLSNTPSLAKGHTIAGLLYEKIFTTFPRLKPVDTIPSFKTDLLKLDPKENLLIWFGHSSYYLQIDGLRFLIDPVFSGNASPIPNTVKAFAGTNHYQVSDLPIIDYLLISHDHYDHLDYETIKLLKDKVKNVICGLGVGSHFENWGYDSKIIIEKNWQEEVEIKNNFKIAVQPARHFSGRGFTRNKTLWVSYVVQAPTLKIYLGGDSGYDTHYEAIGNKYGPFDLAILENGQYNKAWPYIHHTPEEVLKAGKDLKAKKIFPVHSSKFTLANHPWDEPLVKLKEHNKQYHIPLVTPVIGEIVNLNDNNQMFSAWWEGLK